MTEREIQAGSADLLIELGCEELPPKALDDIRDALFEAVKNGLDKNGITFEAGNSRAFSSPRRLALLLSNVASSQADQELERRGPAIQAAFDDQGNPTKAALGFARSVGKDVSDLETLRNDKGEWLYCRTHQAGKPLGELVFPVLEQALRQLPVPRPMRWSDHEFSFVRPVHWLIVMHGKDVMAGELFGLQAGNTTRGHRLHAPGPHPVSLAGEYLAVLREGFVLADPDERRERIRKLLEEAEANVLIDPPLLDEVNNLVEWPVAVVCEFEEAFLEVPHAALIASMQDHQKFFPVLEAPGSDRVSNRFVAVANIESRDFEAVREGYERVIRPRLADARFFLEQDQQQTLERNIERLDRVVFQQKIGTLGDKTRRITDLSRKLAEELSCDPDICARAALLAKCDLVSQMVGEFPELQGEMGRHYALHEGEAAAVADAIGEHYAPRFAGDAIPSGAAGQIVSLADRSDSLVGIFAAGLKPSGNKDPFALRRAALGLVRILVEAGLELPLDGLLASAGDQLRDQLEIKPETLVEVRDFIVERLRSYYSDKGFGVELFKAAVSSRWDTLPDLDRRLAAIASFMGRAEAGRLAAANKRIGNILRKSEEDYSGKISTDRLILAEEQHLFEAISDIERSLETLISEGDYAAALSLLAQLDGPVNAFFDEVMVMDDDLELRRNRLALLARLKSQFDRIGDLSVLG